MPAVPKAVTALRRSEPLNAQPLSPRCAERLLGVRQIEDVLKVQPRRSSPLRLSSHTSSPLAHPASSPEVRSLAQQVESDLPSVECGSDEGGSSGSYEEKQRVASTPSPASAHEDEGETVDEAENGFEHIVLTTEELTACPECGNLLRITRFGKRFCNNVDCDNEELFVLDDSQTLD